MKLITVIHIYIYHNQNNTNNDNNVVNPITSNPQNHHCHARDSNHNGIGFPRLSENYMIDQYYNYQPESSEK